MHLIEVGSGKPLWYSCLENSMGKGAWQVTVRVVAEPDMTEQLSLTHAFKDIPTLYLCP